MQFSRRSSSVSMLVAAVWALVIGLQSHVACADPEQPPAPAVPTLAVDEVHRLITEGTAPLKEQLAALQKTVSDYAARLATAEGKLQEAAKIDEETKQSLADKVAVADFAAFTASTTEELGARKTSFEQFRDTTASEFAAVRAEVKAQQDKDAEALAALTKDLSAHRAEVTQSFEQNAAALATYKTEVAQGSEAQNQALEAYKKEVAAQMAKQVLVWNELENHKNKTSKSLFATNLAVDELNTKLTEAAEVQKASLEQTFTEIATQTAEVQKTCTADLEAAKTDLLQRHSTSLAAHKAEQATAHLDLTEKLEAHATASTGADEAQKAALEGARAEQAKGHLDLTEKLEAHATSATSADAAQTAALEVAKTELSMQHGTALEALKAERAKAHEELQQKVDAHAALAAEQHKATTERAKTSQDAQALALEDARTQSSTTLAAAKAELEQQSVAALEAQKAEQAKAHLELTDKFEAHVVVATTADEAHKAALDAAKAELTQTHVTAVAAHQAEAIKNHEELTQKVSSHAAMAGEQHKALADKFDAHVAHAKSTSDSHEAAMQEAQEVQKASLEQTFTEIATQSADVQKACTEALDAAKADLSKNHSSALETHQTEHAKAHQELKEKLEAHVVAATTADVAQQTALDAAKADLTQQHTTALDATKTEHSTKHTELQQKLDSHAAQAAEQHKALTDAQTEASTALKLEIATTGAEVQKTCAADLGAAKLDLELKHSTALETHKTEQTKAHQDLTEKLQAHATASTAADEFQKAALDATKAELSAQHTAGMEAHKTEQTKTHEDLVQKVDAHVTFAAEQHTALTESAKTTGEAHTQALQAQKTEMTGQMKAQEKVLAAYVEGAQRLAAATLGILQAAAAPAPPAPEA